MQVTLYIKVSEIVLSLGTVIVAYFMFWGKYSGRCRMEIVLRFVLVSLVLGSFLNAFLILFSAGVCANLLPLVTAGVASRAALAVLFDAEAKK